jgi:hypothetical protein
METQRDVIQARLDAVQWEYGDKDPVAIDELTHRIVTTGRKFSLISYSDLVKGVEFHFPNVRSGEPYCIDIYDWSELDRRIIGDCLGYISWRSYTKAKFMASALVVARLESKPSDIFFEWMETLGVLPNVYRDTVLAFWAEQVKRAHHWYKYGKQI